jgi:hypothetical protein
VAQQDFLHLARIDVAAAADDQVFGAILQREEAVGVEHADVAGVQPTAAQGARGRLGVPPVAAHHRVAAHQHLAALAGKKQPVVGIANDDLDDGLRRAHRREALLEAQVSGLGVARLAQRGDGHRALALAVDLRELVAENRHRPLAVLDVHRPAAVDDRLQVAGVGACGGGAVDQAAHHRRRREQRGARMRGDQGENLVRLETAARGNDLLRRRRDVRQDVHPGAVRHRRRVDDAVVLGDAVDVDEVARRHREQVAVTEHRALRPAGGAAGIEQPGGVFGRAGRDRRRFGGGELRIVRILDGDDGA